MRTLCTLLGAGALATLALLPGQASSHREAPLIAQDPMADNTDLYAFVDPNEPTLVTLIANVIPFQDPDGGPNFYPFDPNVTYEIHVDNNADAVEDITFQWKFTTEVRNPATFLYNTGPVTTIDDPDLNVRQFYSLTRIDGPRRTGRRTLLAGRLPVPPPNIGPRSTPNYGALAGGIQQLPGDMRAFAGQRDEGFYVDLAIFDLLGVGSGEVEDSTAGFNVSALALQVPMRDLTRTGTMPAGPSDPNGIIGVWTTTSRPAVATRSAGKVDYTGELVQISRLGNPLVNEAVIDLARKDVFNAITPTSDGAALDRVLDPEVPKLLNLIYGVQSPPAPRNDLVTIFLTGIPGLNQPQGVVASEQLRLNMGIPPSRQPDPMGVLRGDLAGFPNGRRVGDDVTDIVLQAAAGATPLTPGFNIAPNNQIGDGVGRNDVPYLATFPYLGIPHAGNR
ncbi:DUF4331 domain-containing protein [Luteitalea sp.]|uniref:DUF4331 domain-containing protein n=1 Tax=Luteitalea sp. TaxID=2004800 RepID=UPI0025BCD5EB|nr:DUF4331 domain-containing protein [Luteitalea sp.]